jgi:hypothetical protein
MLVMVVLDDVESSLIATWNVIPESRTDVAVLPCLSPCCIALYASALRIGELIMTALRCLDRAFAGVDLISIFKMFASG